MMRRQIRRLLMLLVLLGSLLSGCGQLTTPSSAPDASSQAGAKAAASVASAARMQHLASLAKNSALASQRERIASLLHNPAQSIGSISQLVRQIASNATVSTGGASLSFWERLAKPQSPVVKQRPLADGWRTWAEQVVDQYN